MKSTYYIITIGCQMNKSDSERFVACLKNSGLKEVSQRKEADLVVLNTCGVRQSAEDRVYGLIPKIKRDNPGVKIILTGCLSQRQDVQQRLGDKVDLWLPIIDLPLLDRYLDQLFKGKKGEKIKVSSCPNNYLNIRPELRSEFSAFIPIGNGCNNFCAYCVVPYARGREVYREPEEIITEARDLISRGYKEIFLIAQNVNSYKSENFDFPDLLEKINRVEGDFWIRFATSHPKDMSDKLIKVIKKGKKICPYIHLPVQSGDNRILKAMNRKYTREHYRELVRRIRKNCDYKEMNSEGDKLPVSLTTDIIVGFPGETEEKFKNTEKLFKEINFDMAYIARYSPRPGTVAAEWRDNVSSQEKKEREEGLMRILRSSALVNNKKYKGKVVRVLIESKNKKGDYLGKTSTYKNVKIKPKIKLKEGEFALVKIKSFEDFGLEGELIY